MTDDLYTPLGHRAQAHAAVAHNGVTVNLPVPGCDECAELFAPLDVLRSIEEDQAFDEHCRACRQPTVGLECRPVPS